jgi:hypothetical protein
MLHNEHFLKADRLYEIRHDNNGNAIHVFIKDGEVIVYSSITDLIRSNVYGEEVERFYLDEDDLDKLYESNNYDYYTLKGEAKTKQLN